MAEKSRNMLHKNQYNCKVENFWCNRGSYTPKEKVVSFITIFVVLPQVLIQLGTKKVLIDQYILKEAKKKKLWLRSSACSLCFSVIE